LVLARIRDARRLLRQFKALTDRNMPVTLALNASVCAPTPRVASAALEAGFEFMATIRSGPDA